MRIRGEDCPLVQQQHPGLGYDEQVQSPPPTRMLSTNAVSTPSFEALGDTGALSPVRDVAPQMRWPGRALAIAAGLLLSAAQPAGGEPRDAVHVCVFSDRLDAAWTTIASVCGTTTRADAVTFYIITQNATDGNRSLRPLFEPEGACANASLRIVSEARASAAIAAARGGRKPSWLWPEYQKALGEEEEEDGGNYGEASSPWWVLPARWDHSTMHAHRMNHMRFYLPMILPRDVDRVILLDDDVILLDDVRIAFHAAFEDDDGDDEEVVSFVDEDEQMEDSSPLDFAYLVANCKIWKADAAELHTWQWRSRLNVLQTTHAGLQELYDTGRSIEALCTAEERRSERRMRGRGCMREANFFEELRAVLSHDVLRRLLGDGTYAHNAVAKRLYPRGPLNLTAWNYGMVLADLRRMRTFGAVESYEAWVEANLRHRIFPLTSLGFGLGIPYLATQGRVVCYSDASPSMPMILEGLGFVPPHSIKWNFGGMSFASLISADAPRLVYALHYNGPSKPLANTTSPSFAEYESAYARHASVAMRDRWAAVQYERAQRARAKAQPRRIINRGGAEAAVATMRHRALVLTGGSAQAARTHILTNLSHRLDLDTVCSFLSVPAAAGEAYVRWPPDALADPTSPNALSDVESLVHGGHDDKGKGRPDWDRTYRIKQLACRWPLLASRISDLLQLDAGEMAIVCEDAKDRYFAESVLDAPLLAVAFTACGIVEQARTARAGRDADDSDQIMEEAFRIFVRRAFIELDGADRIPCACPIAGTGAVVHYAATAAMVERVQETLAGLGCSDVEVVRLD